VKGGGGLVCSAFPSVPICYRETINMCGRNMLQEIKNERFQFVWTVYYASVFDVFCLFVCLFI